MKLALIAWLLFSAATLLADEWEFFYPESVRSFGCTAKQVSSVPYGEHRAVDIWQAEAHASRDKQFGNWDMTIGAFPPTTKGRHQAEKACSKWMDEASKRVKAAK